MNLYAFYGFLALVYADGMQRDFCQSIALPNADPDGKKQLPTLEPAFMLDMELTLPIAEALEFIHVDYSQVAGKVHLRVDRPNDSFSEIWTDVARNYEMMVMAGRDSESCMLQNLTKSDINRDFHLIQHDNGTVDLAPPNAILHFNPDNMTYVGNGTTRGGIPADIWQSCQFMPDEKITALVTFYLPGQGVKIPSGSRPLVAQLNTTAPGLTFPQSFNYRYDYVNMFPLSDNQLNRLVPPPDAYCSGTEQGKSLPIPPPDFSFRGETIDKGDPNIEDIIPGKISNSKEIYLHSQQLFIIDFTEFTPHDGYGSTKRHVYDFSLGLEYKIDIITENCDVESIELERIIDYHLAKDNSTRMFNPMQFLHLDKQYQYIGTRVYGSRSIECDVWIAFGRDSYDPAVYTWYFATTKWVRANFQGQKGVETIPVALQVTTPTKASEFNIYAFSANPMDREIPDYSICFDQRDSKIVRVNLNGGSYNQVYLGLAGDFKNIFITTLLKQGKFTHRSRVVALDVQPGRSNSIWISFKLLGTVIFKSNGTYNLPPTYIPTADILTNLKQSISAKKFKFTVTDSATGGIRGTLTATFIGGLGEHWRTTPSGRGHFTRRPHFTGAHSLKPFRPTGSGGKFSHGPHFSGRPKPTGNGGQFSHGPHFSGRPKPTGNGGKFSHRPNFSGRPKPTGSGGKFSHGPNFSGRPKPTGNGGKFSTGPNFSGRPKPTGNGGKFSQGPHFSGRPLRTGSGKFSFGPHKHQETAGRDTGGSGYSAGAMAGLAIGILALGLLAGVVGVILYQRYIGPRVRRHDTAIDCVELQGATSSE